MGIEASKPKPGAKLQVIGAGLPRTGTASFSSALSILLNGPVYHGGTQNHKSPDNYHIRTWTEILSHTPYRNPSDRDFVMQKLRELTTGYVATADIPLSQFVEELMELYPDAKVICTVRDVDAWAKSSDALAKNALQFMLEPMVFWVPGVREWPKYFRALQAGRWGELYSQPGEKWTHGRDVWDRHMQYLEDVVPKEKLYFFDVKQGWGLYALDVAEPPPGIEFPRINDGAAIEKFAAEQVRRGLMRWAVVIGGFALVVGTVWFLY